MRCRTNDRDEVSADDVELILAPARAARATSPTSASAAPATLAELAHRIVTMPLAGDRLEAIEKELVRVALDLSHGNKSQAGRLLGCHRRTIERRMSDSREQRGADGVSERYANDAD